MTPSAIWSRSATAHALSRSVPATRENPTSSTPRHMTKAEERAPATPAPEAAPATRSNNQKAGTSASPNRDGISGSPHQAGVIPGAPSIIRFDWECAWHDRHSPQGGDPDDLLPGVKREATGGTS